MPQDPRDKKDPKDRAIYDPRRYYGPGTFGQGYIDTILGAIPASRDYINRTQPVEQFLEDNPAAGWLSQIAPMLTGYATPVNVGIDLLDLMLDAADRQWNLGLSRQNTLDRRTQPYFDKLTNMTQPLNTGAGLRDIPGVKTYDPGSFGVPRSDRIIMNATGGGGYSAGNTGNYFDLDRAISSYNQGSLRDIPQVREYSPNYFGNAPGFEGRGGGREAGWEGNLGLTYTPGTGSGGAAAGALRVKLNNLT